MALHSYGLRSSSGMRGLLDTVVEDTMGGILDATDKACGATVEIQAGPADANIKDVRDNWRPNGFFTPDQLSQILTFGIEILNKARSGLQTALGQTNLERHHKVLRAAVDLISDPAIDKITDKFVAAVKDARAQGAKAIEAQGLKRWVIDMLTLARNTNVTVAFIQCTRPDVLLGFIAGMQAISDKLVAFVKSVGNFVAKVGDLILKVPDVLSSILSFVKWLPWILVGFGGYYIAVKTELIPPRYDPLRLRERDTFRPWHKQGSAPPWQWPRFGRKSLPPPPEG